MSVTAWLCDFLTPTGRIGNTVHAVDENGRPIAITFADEATASVFQTVIDACEGGATPFTTTIRLSVEATDREAAA